MVNKTVVCGGTFDRLHKGHEEFILFARNQGDFLTIGLTSDAYIRKFKKDLGILSFKKRKQELEQFINSKQLTNVEVVSIDDIFGSLLLPEHPTLVVSEETQDNALTINEKRKKLGLVPLDIVIFSTVNDSNNIKISSSRIRNGETDRNGRMYVSDSWFMHDHLLPESLREKFQKPFGRVIKDLDSHLRFAKNHAEYFITVGDITTELFNRYKINQLLSVVDFKVERKQRFFFLEELGFSKDICITTAENKAGGISANFALVLKQSVLSSKISRTVVQVNGEEDMAVLLLILLLPLNFYIQYGQPGVGMVSVKITESKKKKAHSLASQFIIQG